MCRFLLQGIVFVLAFCRTDLALCAAMSSSHVHIDRENDAAWQTSIQEERKKRDANAQAAIDAIPIADAARSAQMRQAFAEVLEQEGRENPFAWKMPWEIIGKTAFGIATLGTFAWWLQYKGYDFQEKLMRPNVVTLVKKYPGRSVVAGGCIAWLAWWSYKTIKRYCKKPERLTAVLPDGEPYVVREMPSQARSAVTITIVTIEPSAPPSTLINNVPVQQNVRPVKKDTQCECSACKNAREHFKTILMYGTPEEQDALGNEYLHGTAGIKQGRAKKAFILFTVAASRGLPIARHNLGHCYFNGFGVAQDTSKAFELFFDLDKEGMATRETQLYLGMCYLRGSGVRKNLSKAFSYFRSAADNGDIDAQLLMCHMLRKGIFVSQDEALADSYFARIKEAVGSEATAREKLNGDKLCIEFDQSGARRGYVGQLCSICQEARPTFQQGDFISILPCNHYFCQDCLEKWFEELKNRGCPLSCPCCRKVAREQEIKVGLVVLGNS